MADLEKKDKKKKDEKKKRRAVLSKMKILGALVAECCLQEENACL